MYIDNSATFFNIKTISLIDPNEHKQCVQIEIWIKCVQHKTIMLHFLKDTQSDYFAKLRTRLRKDKQRITVSSLSVCPSLESGPKFSEVIRLCIFRKCNRALLGRMNFIQISVCTHCLCPFRLIYEIIYKKEVTLYIVDVQFDI